jgi:hypothetical protein
MIQYTDAVTTLVEDIVRRVKPLSFIDPRKLMVFARPGRSDAEGAYATCHSLNLPTSEPGYYFWRDRATGELTRRTEWFVTVTPEVWRRRQRLDYLISITLPRFCNQTLKGSRKADRYRGGEPWIAKLDTIVHELYHIAPDTTGLRRFECADGRDSARTHGPAFFDDVARLVRAYLDLGPDPQLVHFLRHDFRGLTRRYGPVIGTTFRNFPSYPQRFQQVLAVQPPGPALPVVPLKRRVQPARYTDADLRWRRFSEKGSRALGPSEFETAA